MIIRSVLLEIFALKSETKVDIPNHQRNDARQTPEMKSVPAYPGIEAWKAPSIRLPSIRACGLSHVTTKAVVKTFVMGIFTFVSLSMLVFLSMKMEKPM